MIVMWENIFFKKYENQQHLISFPFDDVLFWFWYIVKDIKEYKRWIDNYSCK